MSHNTHIVYATVHFRMPITAINCKSAEEKIRLLIHDSIQSDDGVMEQFNVRCIENNGITYTYDMGVHAYREQI